MRNPFSAIRHWWSGEDVRIDPAEPDTVGGMGVMHETETRYHWSRRAVAMCITGAKKIRPAYVFAAGIILGIPAEFEKLTLLFNFIKSFF